MFDPNGPIAGGYYHSLTPDGRKRLDRMAMFQYGYANGYPEVAWVDNDGIWWMSRRNPHTPDIATTYPEPIDYNKVCEYYEGPGSVAYVESVDLSNWEVIGECHPAGPDWTPPPPTPQEYAPIVQCPGGLGSVGWILHETPDYVEYQCGRSVGLITPGSQSLPCPESLQTIDYDGVRYCRPYGTPAADNTSHPLNSYTSAYSANYGPYQGGTSWGGSGYGGATEATTPVISVIPAPTPTPTIVPPPTSLNPPIVTTPGSPETGGVSAVTGGVFTGGGQLSQTPLEGCPAGQTLFFPDGSRSCRTVLQGCPGNQIVVSSNGVAACVDPATGGVMQTTGYGPGVLASSPTPTPTIVPPPTSLNSPTPPTLQLPPATLQTMTQPFAEHGPGVLASPTPQTSQQAAAGGTPPTGEIIAGVPNIALLAAAGAAILMFMKD